MNAIDNDVPMNNVDADDIADDIDADNAPEVQLLTPKSKRHDICSLCRKRFRDTGEKSLLINEEMATLLFIFKYYSPPWVSLCLSIPP